MGFNSVFKGLIYAQKGFVSRDSVVGTATRYGLDGPGIETSPVLTGPVAYSAFCRRGTVSFPGVKHPKRGAGHPLPSSADVKNRVGLYCYSPRWDFINDLG